MALRASTLIFLIAAAALLAWMLSGREVASPPRMPASAALVDSPREVSQFVLQDSAGQPFTREQLIGRWSLLTIGFTHCPDVCPSTLAQLGKVTTAVENAGFRVQTIFVSVDPDRDTAQRLADYTAYFNPRFVGLTGTKDELDRLCGDLGFAYVRVPDKDGRYTVDHSTAVALIDPQARVAAYFTQPLKPAAIAADLISLLAASR